MAVTGDAASIPYGPFHPLVPGLADALGLDGPASAYALIKRAILEASPRGLLGVDDAHHLNPSSDRHVLQRSPS